MIVQYHAGTAVVGAVHELGHQVILKRCIPGRGEGEECGGLVHSTIGPILLFHQCAALCSIQHSVIFTRELQPATHYALLAPLNECLSPLLVQGSHWLAKISERCRVVEVQILRCVVLENPGKHWVLRNIVVRAPGNHVELHDILEVRNLSSSP